MSEVQGQFSKQLEEGILDVISPPSDYYPDMANLRKVRTSNHEKLTWN